MELQRIHDTLRARYEANPEDRKALQVARRIKRRMSVLAGRKRRNEASPQSAQKPLTPATIAKLTHHLADAIDQGLPIVAIDCEWDRDGRRPLTEIGIATLQDGQFSVRNIRLYPSEKKSNRFRFGESEFMTPEHAADVLREAVSNAHILCAHAMKNDRVQIKRALGFEIGNPLTFDTQSFARQCRYEKTNLTDCLRNHQIAPKGMHSAGNDAASVIFLILAMLGRRDQALAFGASELVAEVDFKAQAKRNEQRERERQERLKKREGNVWEPLNPNQIKVGHSYRGGEHGNVRTVISIVEPAHKVNISNLHRLTMVNFISDGEQGERSLRVFARWSAEDITHQLTNEQSVA